MFTSRRPHGSSKRMPCHPPEARERPFLEGHGCWCLRVRADDHLRWEIWRFPQEGSFPFPVVFTAAHCSRSLWFGCQSSVADVDCLRSAGCNNIVSYRHHGLRASLRQPRLLGDVCSPLCKRAAAGAALQPRSLLGSRRNIIASHVCLIPLVTPRPLREPSVTSPPCLLRNYLLFWGSPRCGLLLVSEHRGGNQKGAGEKEIGVRLKKERSGLGVGDLPSMMGILLPSLLQRKRGLREICRKVKRPYRFWSRGETGSCHGGAELGSIVSSNFSSGFTLNLPLLCAVMSA